MIPGDAPSPCVLDVPYAATVIPVPARVDILLDEKALVAELYPMTDAHTDTIAARTADLVCGPRPWSFVNRLSQASTVRRRR